MRSSYIGPILKNLSKMEGDLERLGRRAITENMDYVMYLIKERQLSQGLDSYGNELGKYKARTVRYAKDPWGIPPRKDKVEGDPYNMEWTGELFDTLAIKHEQGPEYSIFSTTGKMAFLEQQMGKTLSKLTEEHNKMVNDEVVLPFLEKHILSNWLNPRVL